MPLEHIGELPEDLTDTDAENIDPRELSIEELREEIAARIAGMREINEYIRANDAAHLAMDQVLRRTLSETRQVAWEECQRLKSILGARLKPPPPAKRRGPSPEHLETVRQQREAAELRRTEKRARHEAHEVANHSRQRLFVRAAARALPPEEFERIWDLARTLFPDDPVWDAAPHE